MAAKISETLNEQFERILNEIYLVTREKPVSVVEISELLNEPLTKFGENQSRIHSNKDNISSLKRRIKYCKNPMEKKKLEQKLNLLYKNRKRKTCDESE